MTTNSTWGGGGGIISMFVRHTKKYQQIREIPLFKTLPGKVLCGHVFTCFFNGGLTLPFGTPALTWGGVFTPLLLASVAGEIQTLGH